jgi:hypothetical protein
MPAHTSNILQPLDLANFGPLKTHFRQKVAELHRKLPGKFLSREDLPGFLIKPLDLALSKDNVLAGFKKAGLHPIDFNLSQKLGSVYRSFEKKPSKEKPSLFTGSEKFENYLLELQRNPDFELLKRDVMLSYHLDTHIPKCVHKVIFSLFFLYFFKTQNL